MNFDLLIKEITFKATRSSGAGGQHVNKVSSKIVLSFNVLDSEGLTPEEKEILISKIQTRLTNENILLLNCDESRSQHKNKELVIKRFYDIITNGLKVQKKRRKTKPSRGSVRRRLDGKKKHGLKKTNRKRPDFD